MNAPQTRQQQTLPPTPRAAEPSEGGRLVALALAATGGIGLLGAGLLLWRDRAELVFLDMVASALALCF